MAAVRVLILCIALLGFFLVGAPIQWLVARHAPAHAHHLPLVFCRTLLRLIGVRVSVAGARMPHGHALIVANHVSWIDILALGSITPFCFLAKREVSRWPVLSAFAEVQGTVFVDRERRRTIPPANRRMAERMLEGRAVLLFPEGTTLAETGAFRSSHFAAARDLLRMAAADTASGTTPMVSVQPVAIAYSSRIAAWVGDDALIPHLWRVLRNLPMDCALTFTTPIAYAAGSDRKQVARLSREAVVEALGRRSAAALPAEAGSRDELRPATTGW